MKAGKLIESFVIFPSLNINWMTTNWVKTGEYRKIYDIQFTWLFWYISTSNISKYLKEKGY
jgi:hypothetical protein